MLSWLGLWEQHFVGRVLLKFQKALCERSFLRGLGYGHLAPLWQLESFPLCLRKRAAEEEPSTSTAVPTAKKKPSRGFGDFSSW